MSYLAKKALGGGKDALTLGSSSSSSDGKGIMDRMKGSDSGKREEKQKEDKTKLACIECCICVGFVLVFVGLLVGLVIPLWLKGDLGTEPNKVTIQVGLTSATQKSAASSSAGGGGGSTTGGSTSGGSTSGGSSSSSNSDTISFSSEKCTNSDACKKWKSAGSLARAVIIFTLVCALLAAILACLFCAGDDIFENCIECIPCCDMPGGDVACFAQLPIGELGSAAPRYLSLFPAMCCDLLLFILCIMTLIIYNVRTAKEIEGLEGKLSVGASFIMIVIAAVASCCLGGIHTLLVFIFPAMVAAEAAEEGVGALSSIDVPGI